jgi:hypothetical protein
MEGEREVVEGVWRRRRRGRAVDELAGAKVQE